MQPPENKLDRAIFFRDGLISLATGGTFQQADFLSLKNEFLSDQTTKPMLPRFLRTCPDTNAFWQFIKHEFASYKERRAFLREEFKPLIATLEGAEQPASELITTTLDRFGIDPAKDAWARALARSTADPEGAITAARSLLESVCKSILDLESEEPPLYGPSDDLPKLYKLVSTRLNLAPSQHSEKVFKQILSGCIGVIEGLGELRNKVGDAHGHGRKQVKVQTRHATLAVTLAGAASVFLVESYQTKRNQNNHEK